MKQTNRKSILCPNCRKLISADETKCPHCGMADPGSRVKSTVLQFFHQPEVFVKTMIGINIAMYVLALLLSRHVFRSMMHPMMMLAPDGAILGILGTTGSGVVGWGHGWWTLVAANYLHGSLVHIGFNLLVFWQLCPLMIREYGISRTFIIYTLSGVVGFLISVAAGVYATIGASAAVCGLMGALIYFGKSRGGIYGQEIFRQIGGWAIGIFMFGFLISNINNWGHAGGLAGGAAMGYLLGYTDKARETRLHRRVAGMLAAATAGVLLWGIFLGVFYRFFM